MFHVKQSCVGVHQHPKTWQNARSSNGLNRYAVKYAMKPYQKMVPAEYRNVGRFWGCSRDVPSKSRVIVDVDDEDTRKLLAHYGRKDLSEWEVLPKYCLFFDKSGESS